LALFFVCCWQTKFNFRHLKHLLYFIPGPSEASSPPSPSPNNFLTILSFWHRQSTILNSLLLLWYCVLILCIERILHGGAKIWLLSSSGENNIYERAQRVSKILFLTRGRYLH
jgi:hypothetical protein